jgi:V8-like Glu-specific endopeptidase
MLEFTLKEDIESITLAPNKDAVIFEIIGYYNRMDRVELLVQGARRYQPTNGKLFTVAQSLDLATQVTAHIGQEEAQTVDALQFEKLVRRQIPMLSVAKMHEHMAQIEGQMCIIERKVFEKGKALGSGFLIGPDTVLTNYHVVEKFLHGSQAQNLSVRFDATLNMMGLRELGDGVVFDVQEIVVWRPPGQGEVVGNYELPPAEDELDFAILRLFNDAGRSPIGGDAEQKQNRERHWMQIPDPAPVFEAGDPLIIYQYPEGSELKMAIDTDAVIGEMWDGLRVRYRNNTKPGSSGSPVLNMQWQLVALHHAGEPKKEPVTYNQGIPIARIAKYVRDQGFDDLFGE